MTAFHVNGWFGAPLTVICLLCAPPLAAQQYQTGQDPSKALPTQQVAPTLTPAPPVVLGPRDEDGATATGKGSAQGDQPRTLQLRVDPRTGEPLTAEELKARDAAPAQPAGSAAATDSESAGGIQVQALEGVDPGSIGLLEEADGGLGLRMWQGTSRVLVAQLLPRLPLPNRSAAMRELSRRLLLSVAEAPAGDNAGMDLLALRVERLTAAGWYRQAEQLLRQAPPGSVGPALARARLDSLFLVGNVQDACRLVRNYLDVAESAEWQKATAFCLAVVAQQTEQVELYEQLLYENGIDDPAFFGLLSALTGREPEPVSSLPQPRPLHLAMLRTARKAIPDDAAVAADPAVLRAIATSPNATLNLRLDAAERAHALGLLETNALQRIYASVPFTAAQRADFLVQAKDLPASMAAALLYQVAQIESVPGGRAKVLQAAFDRGRASGNLRTAVEVNAEVLEGLEPGGELAWFAADAGRALLLIGEGERAAGWFRSVLGPAQEGDATAANAVLQLMPLLVIGAQAATIPLSQDVLAGWWQAEVAIQRGDRFDRAALLYGLLEAFGTPVPRPLWEQLVSGPPAAGYMPAPAILRSLGDAAAQGRRGETVLLALNAIGSDGPEAAATPVVSAAAGGLRQIGLEPEARLLALEAMIGRGF